MAHSFAFILKVTLYQLITLVYTFSPEFHVGLVSLVGYATMVHHHLYIRVLLDHFS